MTLLVILIAKSLQIEVYSTILLPKFLICRKSHTIPPKCYNSKDNNFTQNRNFFILFLNFILGGPRANGTGNQIASSCNSNSLGNNSNSNSSQNNGGTCVHCHKTFRQLRSHIQDVHCPTPTPCPLCGKMFSSKHKMFGHKYRSCPNRTRNLVRHLQDLDHTGQPIIAGGSNALGKNGVVGYLITIFYLTLSRFDGTGN